MRRELAGVLASLVEAGFPAAPAAAAAMDAEEADGGDGSSGGVGGGGSVVPAAEAAAGGGAGPGRRRQEEGGATSKRRAYLEPFRAELVSLLMKLLADESGAVREEAEGLLGEVGEVGHADRGPGRGEFVIFFVAVVGRWPLLVFRSIACLFFFFLSPFVILSVFGR